MKRSDWITICSMFVGALVTTIASVVHLSYKIGGMTEKVTSLEKNIERIDKAIVEIKTDVREMKADISKLQVEVAEVRVKVDELWDYHVNQLKSTKTASKVKLVSF